MFDKVLVANRGEIAVRIFRSLRDLGIGSVAVYSDVDRSAVHPGYADEAYALGGATSAESYLVVEKLLAAAEATGAGAVHPGYGFLAENAGFARAVEDAGLVWIGPPPAAIELMGSKTRARQAMQAAGVPIIPGTTDPVGSAEEVVALGEQLGYPLLIKAAAGGGGKGMKTVYSAGEAAQALESAEREGRSYFADASVYVERYLEDPRHVEVQVLADSFGNVIHLGERDCTIQRRHQKLVEETPSPAVSEELRARIGQIAVDAARAAGYRSAGTIEGLLAPDGSYYFMEMNTRIQVEHTVTELVTGLDLVAEQVRIADGQKLALPEAALKPRGASIECRIYAEDAARNFMPSAGEITRLRLPAGPGIRTDAGVYHGFKVPIEYDPLIAKVVSWGEDRAQAVARIRRALEETVVEGLTSNVAFHRWLLARPEFILGDVHTGFLGEVFTPASMKVTPEAEEVALLAASLHAHSKALSVRPVERGSSNWRYADRIPK
jgi:acetyl-CoA carboxylase biotin carboxylase subunit